jgi:hypothetical protein
MTLNTLSTGAANGDFGERTFIFEKQKNKQWRLQENSEYIFRGYRQLNAEFSRQKNIED